MNIRIGNDIKVKFTIRGPQGFDKVNVKQMRVYFINSAYENVEEDCINKRRFPKEPFPQFYTPTKYAIHGCGPWHYNTPPRKCDYANFCPGINDPHIWPYYNGFGLTPDKFVDCVRGIMSGKPKSIADAPIFLAPSLLTEEDSGAEAYFPACEQMIAGPYKMVVILVMYESGWGRNNLHTYTIDYGTLFNLVDDNTGMTGNIVIDGDTGELIGNKILRMYFAETDYYVNINSQLQLGTGSDLRDNQYKLYTVVDNGSVIEYRYTMFTDTKLEFESSDSAVTVTYEGNLIINDSPTSKDVTITVKDPEGTVTAQCTVHVDSTWQKEYLGFAPTNIASEIDLDGEDSEHRPMFTAVDNLDGNYTVENYNRGYYLWFFSKSPIKDVQCRMFDVPLAEPVKNAAGYYCYHCPNKLIATTFDFTIER